MFCLRKGHRIISLKVQNQVKAKLSLCIYVLSIFGAYIKTRQILRNYEVDVAQIRPSSRFHWTNSLRFQGFSQCSSSLHYQYMKRVQLSEKARQKIKIANETSPNLFWYAVEPTWSCLSEKRVGTHGDGGKYLCGYDFGKEKVTPARNCVIYSFGSAGQDDFEKFMSSHTRCEMHIFDPTPRIKKDMAARVRKYGAHFHSIGLGGINGKANKNGIWQNKVNEADLKFLVLSEIMDKFQHNRIDILKVDIEGSEYDAFEIILEKCDLDIEIILVELHLFGVAAREKIFQLIFDLERCGYRMYHKEPNYQGCHGTKCIEFAFTRSDCKHESPHEILNFNHKSNLAERKFSLIKYKDDYKKQHNPRLFWDFYEPDSVCKSLKRIGGFIPEGLYTCSLKREKCHVILFGDFHTILEDFSRQCEVVEHKSTHEIFSLSSESVVSSYSLVAIRFVDKINPEPEIYKFLTGLISRSCDTLPVQISIELLWNFGAQSFKELSDHVDSLKKLFASLEKCNYSVFHKEPNLVSGRGHRYLMYSWVKFEHLLSDWF